jgi:hypothetical protein
MEEDGAPAQKFLEFNVATHMSKAVLPPYSTDLNL